MRIMRERRKGERGRWKGRMRRGGVGRKEEMYMNHTHVVYAYVYQCPTYMSTLWAEFTAVLSPH